MKNDVGEDGQGLTCSAVEDDYDCHHVEGVCAVVAERDGVDAVHGSMIFSHRTTECASCHQTR